MGFFIRKSKKILPGVRVNASKSGPGISVGTKGLRVAHKQGETTLFAGREGLYYRKRLDHPGSASTSLSSIPSHRSTTSEASGAAETAATSLIRCSDDSTPPADTTYQAHLSTPIPRFGGIPRTQDQLTEQLATKPAGWEHLVWAGLISNGIRTTTQRFADRLFPTDRQPTESDELVACVWRCCVRLGDICDVIDRSLNAENQALAFGPRGSHGDFQHLRRVASDQLSALDQLLALSEDASSLTTTTEGTRLLQLLVGFVDMHTVEYRNKLIAMVDSIDEVPRRIASGVPARLEINLGLNDHQVQFDELVEEANPSTPNIVASTGNRPSTEVDDDDDDDDQPWPWFDLDIEASEYLYGYNGRSENPKKALELYRQCVRLGSPDACFEVGEMLRTGSGCTANSEEAVEYFIMGIERGHAFCYRGIAEIHLETGNQTEYQKCERRLWDSFERDKSSQEMRLRVALSYIATCTHKNWPLELLPQIRKFRDNIIAMADQDGVKHLDCDSSSADIARHYEQKRLLALRQVLWADGDWPDLPEDLRS